MRVPRIFQNNPLQTSLEYTLDEQATRHLMTVLRLKTGDKIILFNGDGHEYPATISHVKSHAVKVNILECVDNDKESPLIIHLGQAISKGDRMDYTLQKATELGVASITPLFSTRSEVRLKGEREEKKMSHWQKVLTNSCEQCGRNRIPILNSPTSLETWVKDIKEETKLLLDHRSHTRLKEIRIENNSVGVLVGPEGGLAFNERHYAEEHGFVGVSMGPRILRTETAGIAAIALLQCMAGDMG